MSERAWRADVVMVVVVHPLAVPKEVTFSRVFACLLSSTDPINGYE